MEIVAARISVSQIYSGCVKTREEGGMVARQESPTGREFCHKLYGALVRYKFEWDHTHDARRSAYVLRVSIIFSSSEQSLRDPVR